MSGGQNVSSMCRKFTKKRWHTFITVSRAVLDASEDSDWRQDQPHDTNRHEIRDSLHRDENPARTTNCRSWQQTDWNVKPAHRLTTLSAMHFGSSGVHSLYSAIWADRRCVFVTNVVSCYKYARTNKDLLGTDKQMVIVSSNVSKSLPKNIRWQVLWFVVDRSLAM